MNFKLLFALILVFSGITSSLQAQSNDQLAANTVDLAELVTIEADDNSKIFFTDPDSKICYIDFEAVNGFAKHLLVKEGQTVIIDEALWELPTNTIYELDFESFNSGEYQIELYTYKTVVKKSLEVK
ncbi:MAG: hypothetical protein AAF598_14660 [Bacteroidota bacterium]